MFADILVEIYWQALEILREMWPTIWYPKLNRQNDVGTHQMIWDIVWDKRIFI